MKFFMILFVYSIIPIGIIGGIAIERHRNDKEFDTDKQDINDAISKEDQVKSGVDFDGKDQNQIIPPEENTDTQFNEISNKI